MRPKTPLLTVDAIIITDGKEINYSKNSIVLIKRKNDPFRGMWALPGGFVDCGETVEDAVKREAKEETGIDVLIEELVGVFSDPGRDPRGHTVSVCFLCSVSPAWNGEMRADTDALDVRKFGIDKLPELAFDHKEILRKVMGDGRHIL